jgi:hypothetical protein
MWYTYEPISAHESNNVPELKILWKHVFFKKYHENCLGQLEKKISFENLGGNGLKTAIYLLYVQIAACAVLWTMKEHSDNDVKIIISKRIYI